MGENSNQTILVVIQGWGADMGQELQQFDGVIVLDGKFFLRPYLIKAKTEFVNQTLKSLFEFVSFN
ncbi:hypothetical protein EBR57_00345 [bacterium]|nr:hypothetical protein [bacterium]